MAADTHYARMFGRAEAEHCELDVVDGMSPRRSVPADEAPTAEGS